MAFIYKITNDINNKVYIGETAIGIEHRWRKHVQDLYKRNFKLQLAMRKYGIEHFQIEQIEECDFDNRFEREKFWIARYDSYYNGYNSTLGGEGATKYDYDEVYQLWIEGKTPQELSELTGASDGTIQNILRANSVPPEKIHERAHSKPVIQFTIKGEYVCIYPSANAAGRALGLVNGSNIIACCNGKLKSSSGYIWKYAEDETLIEDYLLAKKKKTTGKKVMQFDLNNNFLAEFPSCEAAARELELSSSTPINRCARGERKTAYGFKWKYAGEV